MNVLVENHRRFLSFLERRVGSREAVEDILQDAFVRGLYRLLRNAVIDHYCSIHGCLDCYCGRPQTQ